MSITSVGEFPNQANFLKRIWNLNPTQRLHHAQKGIYAFWIVTKLNNNKNKIMLYRFQMARITIEIKQ